MRGLITISIIFLYALNLYAAPSEQLKRMPAMPNELNGKFTIILYGANHINDLETIAIIDIEGDSFYFDLYTPAFLYKVKTGLTTEEALHDSIDFVRWHNSFYKYELSKIVNHEGITLGYEVRPLYYPLSFGVSDVLDVNYFLENKRIRVTIRLIPSVERFLFDGNNILFEK